MARIFFHAGLAALLLWLVSAEHLRTITWYDAAFQPILTSLIMASIVHGAVFGGAPQWFGKGIGNYIARISYPVYLFHIPVIPITFLYTRLFLAAKFPGISLTAEFLIFAAAYLFMAWLVSELMHSVIEKRFYPERIQRRQ
jgi:peptidoglycan/LPS O-acetylase OafA/YrhL